MYPRSLSLTYVVHCMCGGSFSQCSHSETADRCFKWRKGAFRNTLRDFFKL